MAKKFLKSRNAREGVTHVIENTSIFNREKFPVKIKEIGLGGSALRTKNPRDIDITVKAEFEKGFNLNKDSTEYLKRVLREKLSQNWKGPNLDFHIFISNAFSDRWIPNLAIWNWRNGYIKISSKDVEKLHKNEFRELSAIVGKIEKCDESLPPFFRKSIELMKNFSRKKTDMEFKNYLSRELNEMIQLCKKRNVPLNELNTLLRSKMKKFGLAGLIHSEIKDGVLYEHRLKKFDRCGLSKEVDHLLKILNLHVKRN